MSTEQNLQALVQTDPINMIVAVPWLQHSPMFGQCDSSHTVDRLWDLTISLTVWYLPPVGILTLSQSGFFFIGLPECFEVLIPSLIAVTPFFVRNLTPLCTLSLTVSLILMSVS